MKNGEKYNYYVRCCVTPVCFLDGGIVRDINNQLIKIDKDIYLKIEFLNW